MNITEYLNTNGFYEFEGYSQECQAQVEDLIELTKNGPLNVMEIGFNAGHSAEVFLKNNDQLKLTSFDLGIHNYVAKGKEYIDLTYPGRHELILGDSTVTVPEFIKNTNTKFDVIFIDGGHDYEIAKADVDNCFYLSHKDTIVILDDTLYNYKWYCAPTHVWLENVTTNKITELVRKNYEPGRGISWGKYVFKD